MNKELFVSTTPHETKVGITEDDQLAEIYLERENEYTLAGSIYKGRVTRVLPGMQSAFVDIGLERDAFLYVTDFLLEEDEEVDVIDQGTSRPARGPVQRTEERYAPIEADEVIPPAELVADTPNEQTAETRESGPGQVGEREGARKWRGRRRRRGGRGHFPDREEREPKPQEPASQARTEVAERSEHFERPQRHEHHEPAAELPPIILPGESLSKYQAHTEVAPSSRTQTSPPPSNRRKPSTEYSVQNAPISPDAMVLPGETIAKYKHGEQPLRRQSRPPITPAQTHEEVFVSKQPEAEQAAPHHAEVVVADHAAEVHAEHVPQAVVEEPKAQEPVVAAIIESPVTPLPQAEQHPQITQPRRDDEPQRDQAATAEIGDEAPAATGKASAGADHPQVQADSHERSPWHASGAGVMEEEVIDEDESEIPEFEEHMDLADDEELEEEVLDVPMGTELTEAVRDAHLNERATGDYESEGLGGDEQSEEGEDGAEVMAVELADDDEELEATAESEEPEGARAEQRASAGTAGYQQRTDRRGDRQNRRPGRRMRGRPRQFTPRQQPVISDLLKEGQEILVQIAKEPIAKKGARITSHIALPGRFLVYMPTVEHLGVSRKIASDEDRHRLKRIVMSERGEAHGGFIVRTAAAGASEDDLRADIRFLINLWNEIRGRAESSKAPSLLYHDLNLVERILRDQVTASFGSMWVDTEQEYERIVRFVSRFQPSMLKRVKLYTKDTPLFEQFGITDEINKALKSKVWLKSGGYIVINQTEALVAIDINTGKFVGKTARLEDTIVKTNVDAIKEIVRQIRLRDL